MDLNQRKLNRTEWNSVEVPVSKSEIDILNMIINGYQDVNIRINNNSSIFTFLKIEYTEKMEDFIYNKYIRERGEKIELLVDFILMMLFISLSLFFCQIYRDDCFIVRLFHC